MASITINTTIQQYQDFIRFVYGRPNDIHFELSDMLSNMERFTMRALKGIRKKDNEKIRINLLISLSWFISTLNRLHINLEDAVWNRFPYLCSYCASCPCLCKEDEIKKRKKVFVDHSKRPVTLENFQEMFNRIYPSEERSLDHAGVHLAEELGEFSEALLVYRGGHKNEHINNIFSEAADIFSCFVGVFNSLDISFAKKLYEMFPENCHACRKAPCKCDFDFIMNYRS